MACEGEEDPAVSRFREYLCINTISSLDLKAPHQPDYDSAVKFLTKQAEEIGLEAKCIEVHPKRPVLILTWQGSNPSLPSIMLNSHLDVVPVSPEHWDSDPFAAHKRPNGDIVARGAQDMKCVSMWYLEAVRRLKVAGTVLLRTIHLTYVPDEEIGGALGMQLFVKTEEFQSLNVGFCLDEGLANPEDAYTVFYGERAIWWFDITCTGNPGHSSRFIEDTAMEKMHKLISLILDYRSRQKQRLNSDPTLKLGDVSTVNVPIVRGGSQYNVVAPEVMVGVDLRISPFDQHQDMQKLVDGWAGSVGGKLTFIYKSPEIGVTSIDPSDPWWGAFKGALAAASGRAIETEIFSCGTDGRFLRAMNIPALGFSPMRNTPILLHSHNERLNEKIYLEGIQIYAKVIHDIANVRI